MTPPSETDRPRWVVAASRRNHPWAPTVASILFTCLEALLFYAYSRLHWRVLPHLYVDVSEPLRTELFGLLRILDIYRFCGLLAVVFAVWAIRHRPHWPGYGALALSLIAALEALSIQ